MDIASCYKRYYHTVMDIASCYPLLLRLLLHHNGHLHTTGKKTVAQLHPVVAHQEGIESLAEHLNLFNTPLSLSLSLICVCVCVFVCECVCLMFTCVLILQSINLTLSLSIFIHYLFCIFHIYLRLMFHGIM